MSNAIRLQNIRTALDSINNDETRVACACVLASGETNANSTLGWDNGATEDWCKLAIVSIESLLENESAKVQEFFKSEGISF